MNNLPVLYERPGGLQHFKMASSTTPPVRVNPEGQVHRHEDDNEGVAMLLGRLRADVAHLSKKLDDEIKEGRRQQSVTRQTLDAVMESMRQMRQKVEVHDEWGPWIDQYKRGRYEARGRRRLLEWVNLVWLSLGGGIVLIATKIFEHFQWTSNVR